MLARRLHTAREAAWLLGLRGHGRGRYRRGAGVMLRSLAELRTPRCDVCGSPGRRDASRGWGAAPDRGRLDPPRVHGLPPSSGLAAARPGGG
jgi:hypothetical protein